MNNRSFFSSDLTFGKKGEDFFKKNLCIPMFGIRVTDRTADNMEGEFSCPNGALIEVKSDSYCIREGAPTLNIPIEIRHSGHALDKGWYFHLKQNGVTHLVFCLFRGRNKDYPAISIKIPFSNLEKYVDEKLMDATYVQEHYHTTYNGQTGNLLIPVKEIMENCAAEEWNSVLPAKVDEVLRPIALKALKKANIEGEIGKPFVLFHPEKEGD